VGDRCSRATILEGVERSNSFGPLVRSLSLRSVLILKRALPLWGGGPAFTILFHRAALHLLFLFPSLPTAPAHRRRRPDLTRQWNAAAETFGARWGCSRTCERQRTPVRCPCPLVRLRKLARAARGRAALNKSLPSLGEHLGERPVGVLLMHLVDERFWRAERGGLLRAPS
jgi:hypothetical protein